MTRTITDTADRLRTTDQVLLGGTWALVLDITHAATPAHPARLAVAICDPNGALTDLDSPEVVHINAGDTVTYRPHSTHLADAVGRRPGAPTEECVACGGDGDWACGTCVGSGVNPDRPGQSCDECAGTGLVECNRCDGKGKC